MNLIENNSKKYANGTVHPTNNCGNIVIIGKCNRPNFYYCKFEDETIVEVSSSSIIRGRVRNPNISKQKQFKKDQQRITRLMTPSLYGIGFMGQTKYKSQINGKMTKEYRVWHGMIKRCYDPRYQEKNHTYKNCTVDPRWHSFSNFCDDIVELEGYELWKNSTKPREYALDKDKLIEGNKIYSKYTCCFITQSENSQIAMGTNDVKYKAIRLSDDYIELFDIQIEFAKRYDLYPSSINACIKGKQNSTGGWMFEIV